MNTTKELGEVTTLVSRGVSPKYVDEDGYTVINQRCIRDNRLNLTDSRLTDKERTSIKPEKYVQKWDVLVNSTGVGTLGRTAQVIEKLENTTIDTHVTIVRPDLEVLYGRYLGYVMALNEPIIENLAKGATGQTELSRHLLSEIEITIPQYSTQKRIASILSAFDDLIENNTRRIEILEEMTRLIYREWFVHYRYPGHEDDKMVESGTDMGEIPEGWEVQQLKDFINFKNGKSARDKGGDRYPIYGANGIIGKSDESKWENGIIIGRVGAYCGEVEYCEGKFWASDNTIVATPKDEYDYPLFSYLKLEDLNLRRYAGGSAQPLMTQTVIKDIQTVIPSSDSMGKFQIIASKLWIQKRTLEMQNKRLKQTRDLLLPKLISGKVEVDKI